MKFLLIFVAFSLWLFGLIYLLVPAYLAGEAGLSANPSGLTDIRATYGGFQLGFGTLLFYCAFNQDWQRIGVIALAMILGAVGICRAVGVIVDGSFSGFHQIGLGFEITVTAISIFLLRNNKAPS